MIKGLQTTKQKDKIKIMAKSKSISNKTKVSCTLLNRVSPRLKAKRDALDLSQKNADKKSDNELKESCKSQKITDGRLSKSCNKNLPISVEEISTMSSTILDPEVSKKRRHTVPIPKKKSNGAITNKKGKAKEKVKVSRKSLPTKGTLKRKRYIINALKERSEGYEDDIFESNKFDKFKETLFLNDSDTSIMSVATPKCAFAFSPRMPAKTPRRHFKDIYSPMELMKARKAAEEYIHLRNKRKLHSTPVSETEKENVDSEKKKLDFISLAKNLNKEKNKSEDSDEDVYFSDAAS